MRDPLPMLSPDDYFGQDAAAQAFRDARDEVRRFWQVGSRSLKEHPSYPRGPNDLKAAEAAKLGWNPERLRQARLFASRCTEKELERRIAEAQEHNYPPYWSTLVAVFQVTDRGQRESLWKDCLVQNLSRHDVVARIRAGNLPRDIRVTAAGRTMKAPKTDHEARVRLLQEAERLLRLNQVCRGVLHPDGLPADARRALQRAVRAATDLREALKKITARRRRSGR